MTAKIDSGATGHYFWDQDKTALTQVQKLKKKPTILLPKWEKIHIREKGCLKLPAIDIMQQVNIVPKLASASLLSVGKFIDDGCEAHFTNKKAIISKNNKTILQGNQKLVMTYITSFYQHKRHRLQIINKCNTNAYPRSTFLYTLTKTNKIWLNLSM